MEKTRALTPVAASSDFAAGGRRDHSTKLGQEGALVQEKMEAMQILSAHNASSDVSLSLPPAPAPLTLSLQSKQGTGTLVDEEPDSPTSPGSCISPHAYTPLKRTFSFGEYMGRRRLL
ncbi:unnamed protein product [Urochloa humidicola]